jgi:RNA polymerase sigma-70 factor (ECF subfamily)
MSNNELIPQLFRTEFSKLTAVLSKSFGLKHIEVAEDLVSDTFLLAAETWGLKGIPENPTAWLYTVAKNKTKDFLRRSKLFTEKISPEIKTNAQLSEDLEIDFSNKNIQDSQLQMMFAICHPAISAESQITLSLRVLCGFGIEEIADAFLSQKETINKRLYRAKEALRLAEIKMELPSEKEIENRLQSVLTTLYLLFNEGYYSASQNTVLRKDLCIEAMRLNLLLIQNDFTDKPQVNALMALMCFHASRFEARLTKSGEIVLYEEQDTTLWDQELIVQGEYFMNQSALGDLVTKYHLEAGIAYWHTQKTEGIDKWEAILQLYNKLLQIEYSPMAALNRTYALAKTTNAQNGIKELEKINLKENHLYYALLGHLYINLDQEKAKENFTTALRFVKGEKDKILIQQKIKALENIT